MQNIFGRVPPLLERVGSVALLLALMPVAGTVFAADASAGEASVRTFDRVTYNYPEGFEAAPQQGRDHFSFRRIDPASWILISIYEGRVVSRDPADEFAIDWNGINTENGAAAPASARRRVGSNVPAREGGVFIPTLGYVDLVEVHGGGYVNPIIIECGSADQFQAYQPVIESFLASLVLGPGPGTEPGANPPLPAATPRSVDYVNDGFVWTGADGLEHVPALTPVGSGAGFPASIPGVWQDDHQQFTLELAADGTYASAYAGASVGGPIRMGEFAGSASNASIRLRESGHWMAVGTRLTLTPESAGRYTRNLTAHHGGEEARVDAGGPRTYEVTTLALEYHRNELVYRIDGIQLNGPPAPWYYSPSGNFSIVLRRTGALRAK